MTRKVGVVMGGISSEHPVSLVSGTGMLARLDSQKYDGFPVLISRENEWMWPQNLRSPEGLTADRAKDLMVSPPADWYRCRFPDFTHFPHCDILLLGLHGIGGEDGRLQGFLEMAKQPFTGSGSLGAAQAMDKIASKHLYRAHGIPTAPYHVLPAIGYSTADLNRIETALGYPLLVKHPKGGSSLGLGIAHNRNELVSLTKSLAHDTDLLLYEGFILGKECSSGVLVGMPALPPTEIRPVQDGFFSFEAKYEKGRAQEITPAEFPPEIIKRVQERALACHQALRLDVYSRTDFIWAGDEVFALETNNLPGFTPNSLLPQQAIHVGLDYTALLSFVIESSLARFSRE